MKQIALLSILTVLAGCGGGGGSGTDYGIAGNGSQNTTSPINSSQNLADMQFDILGGRDWDLGYVKLSQNENGDIETITIKESKSMSDPEFILISKDGKYKSQTIYRYSLPIESGYNSYSFTSDKELTTEQVKQKFRELADNASSEILALIDGLTDQDKKVSSGYDMDAKYTNSNIGKYFVSPQSFTMDLKLYGQQVGLQFSDFGKITGKYNVGNKSYDRAYVFAGGYDTKSINKADMSGKMTFHGNAVGQVMYHYSDKNNTSETNLDLSSDADLVFNNGKETLTMNFADNKNAANRWYNVKFESDANGQNATLYLTDGDKIAAQNEKYKFTNADVSKTYTFTKTQNGYETNNTDYNSGHLERANFQSTYYGDNGTPSEAVGQVSFVQQDWSDDNNKEIHFFGAFGAVQ